jgi:TPP-dependent pyruvate/acetoin dehydrogenase alpha subunit
MGSDASGGLASRDRIGLLRAMMMARASEQRARILAGGDDGAEPAPRWHREPIGAGAAAALLPGDRMVAPGRYAAAHAKAEEPVSIGRSSSAPDLVPEAVGVALAIGTGWTREVVLTLVDEGAMASVRWSEALALATARRLALVVVVERDRPLPAGALGASAGRALLGEAVDAHDPEAVRAAVRAAADRARNGRGPALVTCVTPRAVAAPTAWRRGTESVEVQAPEDDPIELYARRLVRGGIPRADVEAAIRAVEDEVLAWQA